MTDAAAGGGRYWLTDLRGRTFYSYEAMYLADRPDTPFDRAVAAVAGAIAEMPLIDEADIDFEAVAEVAVRTLTGRGWTAETGQPEG